MSRRANWEVLYLAREIWQKGFRTFDTETTGLGRERNDEIVQWAICSQDGELLGSGYVKPTVPISEGAFTIHGLTDEQLQDAPTFDQIWPQLRELLAGRTVVIYNADFDLMMLRSSAMPYQIKIPFDALEDHCAMELFARFYGELHDYYGSYVWQKLETAIAHLGLEVPGQAHDATHDAAATALIIKKLAELADQELPVGWHPPISVPCAGGCTSMRLCDEADEVWYCLNCGLERSLFHRCPKCNAVVQTPDLLMFCEYCQKALYLEEMLTTGQWHRCPGKYCSQQVVERADPGELCDHCKRQYEWKRQAEERERLRIEKIEKERKEARRAYARDYRQRQKEFKRQNALRLAQGLPPLEKPKPVPREQQPPFSHKGHLFKWIREEDGSYVVQCQKCQAVWSRPPDRPCYLVPTYRAWQEIPKHLLTATQLHKIGLKPAKDQLRVAIVIGQFDYYSLYERDKAVPQVRREKRVKVKG